MVAPFGAAAAIVVPVATIMVATAIASVVMTIAAVIVPAEITAVAAMVTAVIVVAIPFAMAAIALRLSWSGGAETERCEGQSGSDEMGKLHEMSSRTRQSGCAGDTAIERHRS
jgi:choline-glycine betaine transporter